MTTIVWFKRDLRVEDHPPLIAAANGGGEVLPLYIFEPEYWQLPDTSWRHWQFIHASLAELNEALTELGAPLLVSTGDAMDVLSALHQNNKITRIVSHEETGNLWTFERDKKVKDWCDKNRIAWDEFPNNGVIRRLANRDDWSKMHHIRMQEEPLHKPKSLQPVSWTYPTELPDLDEVPALDAPTDASVQLGGRKAGLKCLGGFLATRAKDYRRLISKPGVSARACSRLSPHLAYGTLSAREVFHACWARLAQLKAMPSPPPYLKAGISAMLSRMHWHCHFIQKLESQPSIETHCMHPAYEGMRPQTPDQIKLDAWYRGQTGYPLVDACMRSLHENGWLTFRMRAMVVSFASYDLWLDWRHTGPLLAKLFTDYEPGIHYSQLQMQSGVTGINTLRIYNPIKQSEEHDTEGKFIKRYVPELKHVPLPYIHEPWGMPPMVQKEAGCMIGINYPNPIVEHTEAIRFAREAIKHVRQAKDYQQGKQKVLKKLASRKPARKKTVKKKADDKQMGFDFD